MTNDIQQLRTVCESLGFEIRDAADNWLIVLLADPNGVSGPSPNLLLLRPDGKIEQYCDVNEDLELADILKGDFEVCDSIQEFHDVVLDMLVEDILDSEVYDFARIVKTMMAAGWERRPGSEGGVRFANDHSLEFESWQQALEWSIEQATKGR